VIVSCELQSTVGFQNIPSATKAQCDAKMIELKNKCILHNNTFTIYAKSETGYNPLYPLSSSTISTFRFLYSKTSLKAGLPGVKGVKNDVIGLIILLYGGVHLMFLDLLICSFC
jgi:hypothetical protein